MTRTIPLPLQTIKVRSNNELSLAKWDNHIQTWANCTKCVIGSQACRHVFGRGTIQARTLIVGEAPGEQEDSSGYAFVGPSGVVLQSVLDRLPDRPSYSWFITNTVMCWPRERNDTRPPTPEEQINCWDRTVQLIDIVRPKKMLLLGRAARMWFEASDFSTRFKDNYLFEYHPSFLLRSGGPSSRGYDAWSKHILDFMMEPPK